MQHDHAGVPLPHTRTIVPWNKGRFIGPKPPFKPKQVWAIRLHLQRERRIRDLALFDLAIDSKLRGCDLVRLRMGQVAVNATVRHRATIVQKKTERPVRFELTEQTRDSLLAWLIRRGGSPDDYVFPSRVRTGKHLSTRQYARLVGGWWRRSGSAGQPTAPTACAGPRSPSSTSGPATCGPCRSCLAIRSWRARCGTWASKPRMP